MTRRMEKTVIAQSCWSMLALATHTGYFFMAGWRRASAYPNVHMGCNTVNAPSPVLQPAIVSTSRRSARKNVWMAVHAQRVRFWTVNAVWKYLSVPVCTWDDIFLQDHLSLRTATPACAVMVPGNAPMKAALVSVWWSASLTTRPLTTSSSPSLVTVSIYWQETAAQTAAFLSLLRMSSVQMIRMLYAHAQ